MQVVRGKTQLATLSAQQREILSRRAARLDAVFEPEVWNLDG